EDAAVLRATLTRLLLLAPDDPLPQPDCPMTGVRAKSRVLLLFLPDQATGKRLIAKFDQPDRARQEWGVIDSLRKLNVPPETILPHSQNQETDGVIIYPAAGSHRLKQFVPFARFLRDNLAEATGNCVRALKLALEPLRFFYDIEPGHTLPA